MEETAPAIGITSDLGSGMHCVQLDYDIENLRSIKARIRRLISKFFLGDAYIYRTNHGFHVKFYGDEVRFKRYATILLLSGCCKNFIARSLKDKYSTLRIAGKYIKNDINFVCVEPGYLISDSRKENAKNRRKFEEKLMGIEVPKDKAFKNGKSKNT